MKPTERTERLRKEYRSATNSVSIRAIWRDDEHKEKKRQLFELRGHDAISKEKLLELAEESCAKILEGQDEATVKSWALDELNKRKKRLAHSGPAKTAAEFSLAKLASKNRISWELLCCMFFLEGLHAFSKWQEAFF